MQFPWSTAFLKDRKGVFVGPSPDSPTETAQGAALELRSVTKTFGGLVAVDDIDLDVVHGQRLGLLGPNGAGKTTLFNLIAGDMRPTSGVIQIGGVDCTMLASRHRASLGVARTYQRTRLFGGLSVADNLYLAQTGKSGRHRALWRSAVDSAHQERARDAAGKVWLSNRIDDMVDDLSHGERRQLEVAMALVTDPVILRAGPLHYPSERRQAP
jgi:branched-chain amino acid transport system ATP-binding protein